MADNKVEKSKSLHHGTSGLKTISKSTPTNVSQNKRDMAAQEIMQKLRVVIRFTQAHSRWVEKQCGVSSAQLWAMWELFSSPGLKVSELSKALSIHQSTTSNMLDKLEEKNLIRRERSGPDQRVVRLFLTRPGVTLIENAPKPVQGAVTEALEQLSESELRKLQQGLQALVTSMATDAEPAAEYVPL
ncbi:MarR family winged helix-turn-helix transcriptional regulator [Kaarinaea lacus]